MSRRAVRVKVAREAVRTIGAAADAASPRETGGLLLGWWDAGSVVVHRAIEVPDPFATGSAWTRHEQPAQQALELALGDLQHPWLGYVGDWHTHPVPCMVSSQDLRSIERASRQYEHPLVLFVRRADATFDVRVAHRGRPRAVNLTLGDDPKEPADDHIG